MAQDERKVECDVHMHPAIFQLRLFHPPDIHAPQINGIAFTQPAHFGENKIIPIAVLEQLVAAEYNREDSERNQHHEHEKSHQNLDADLSVEFIHESTLPICLFS